MHAFTNERVTIPLTSAGSVWCCPVWVAAKCDTLQKVRNSNLDFWKVLRT